MMKKQLVAAAAVTALTTTLVTPFPTSAEGVAKGKKSERTFDLTLMHTNDTHSHVEKFPSLMSAIKDYRSQNPEALLVDAGDVFSGTLYFNEFLGQVDAKLMNYADYDYMTLGNHEFDVGGDADGNAELRAFIEALDFPVVSSNIDFSADTVLAPIYNKNTQNDAEAGYIHDAVIHRMKGEPVGIIGLTTEETAVIASPGSVAFQNYIAEAQKAVDSLEKRNVNKIIVLSHLGYNDNPEFDNDLMLAKYVDGIDVIVGGHSHDRLLEPVKVGKAEAPTLITQADQYRNFLGTLNVTFDSKGQIINYAGKLIDASKYAPDETAVEMIKPYKAQIDQIMNTEIGAEALTELSAERGLVRTQEAPLGNLIADGMLDKAKEFDPNTTIAFMNGGGIRATINSGPITLGEILTTLPFGNTLATMKLTGAEVKEALEQSVSIAPNQNGGFLQVAGMKFEYDSSKPAKSRVVNVSVNVNGTYESLDMAKTYVVATNAFTAKGGDNYAVFAKAYAEGRVTDLGLSDWENFRDYLVKLKTVDPKVEGRILDVK